MKFTIVLLFLVSIYSFVSCARILGVFHVPSPSHYILGNVLLRALAEKGHDVTMVSPYKEKSIPKGWKYRDIVLTGAAEQMEEHKKVMFDQKGMFANPVVSMLFFNEFGSQLSEETLNHTSLQKLIHSGEKFDVVIVEQFVCEALRGLAPHFGASLVIFSTTFTDTGLNFAIGNPASPSYIPETILAYPAKMNFWQRFVNFAFSTSVEVGRHLRFYTKHNEVIRKYLPNSPNLEEITRNILLVLSNSHVSIGQPVPNLPNIKEIGGFHIKPPEPLPEDLQTLLDSAKEGVVYFSMGSNLRCKDMPVKKRQAILKAFSKLKQKVLWKWEEDVLPEKPANVKIRKWFPQQSILAHPNVKLFVTHGGLLSTIETVYFGVPILALPIFGDQESNSAQAVVNGYGLKLSFPDLNEETFSEKLKEVLENLSYSENAKMRSKIMKDRPIKPIDEAVYWVEYVMRHNGAKHYRSAALDLAWYQYLLLDVIASIIILCVVIFSSSVYLIKLLCCKRKLSSKRNKQDLSKKNKLKRS